MKHKKLMGMGALILMLPILALLVTPSSLQSSFVMQSSKSGVGGIWVIEVKHTDGSVESRWTPNNVTYWGLNLTRDSVFRNVSSFPVFLELSNNTVFANKTTFTCPGSLVTGNALDIGQGTETIQYNFNTAANMSITRTWTSTGRSDGISTICLSNSSATGAANQLFAYGVFSPAVNMASGDQISAFYYPAYT